MTIKVKNCHDCPFCNSDNEYGNSCNFPGSEVEEHEMPSYNENNLPVKCPLQFNGTILIELERADKVTLQLKLPTEFADISWHPK